MYNAVIYARYSSHSQNEQSIETQIAHCTEYAKKNGFNIVGEYVDKAKTGKNDNRESFQKMIEDSKKGFFNYVIIYKIDRFARNRYDSAMNKNKLKKNNVKVLSATENISDDPQGVLIEAVLEGFAEYYSLNLSKNIKDGLETNAKKGLSIGGYSLPLGLKSNEKREIIIDEQTAPIVKKIFEMYRDKSTMADIIRYLNLYGLKTSRKNEFNKNSIRRILTNEKYIGIYTFKGVVTSNNIPRIIDDKLFYGVQEMISKRKNAPARARAKSDYILTTKLFCGYCESMMTGYSGTSKTGKLYNYYACKNSKEGNCNKERVNKQFIEDFVITKAREILTTENIDVIAKKVVDYIDMTKDNSEVNRLNKAIKDNNKQRANLLDSLKLCDIESVRKSIFDEIGKLDILDGELKKELAFEEANNFKVTASQIKFFLKELKKGNVNDERYRKMLIDVFVYRIYLYDNDTVMIVFTTQEKTYKLNIPSEKELVSSFMGQSAPPI